MDKTTADIIEMITSFDGDYNDYLERHVSAISVSDAEAVLMLENPETGEKQSFQILVRKQ